MKKIIMPEGTQEYQIDRNGSRYFNHRKVTPTKQIIDQKTQSPTPILKPPKIKS